MVDVDDSEEQDTSGKALSTSSRLWRNIKEAVAEVTEILLQYRQQSLNLIYNLKHKSMISVFEKSALTKLLIDTKLQNRTKT